MQTLRSSRSSVHPALLAVASGAFVPASAGELRPHLRLVEPAESRVVLGNADLVGLGDFEILGALDELIGDDDLDSALDAIFSGESDLDTLLGAVAKPNAAAAKRAQLLRQVQAARAVDPKMAIVRQIQERRRRVMDLGVPATAAIAAGATATIVTTTPRKFRPEDLVIDDAVAGSFSLTQAFVGQDSQMAGAVPIPMIRFSHLCAHKSGFHWDTAQPGIDITLVVQNITGAPLAFPGGDLVGTTAVR